MATDSQRLIAESVLVGEAPWAICFPLSIFKSCRMTMTCFMFVACDSSNYRFSSLILYQITTPASRKFAPRVLSFNYTATRPESKSRFRFDRFNFSEESLVAIRQERIDHVERGATK